MPRCGRWGTLVGVMSAIGLMVTVAWAQTPAPPAKTKLERLRVAIAPLGWDTNFTWLQSRSGMLDKRPALEYLVGIDRNTGAYIPELAEKWEMSPNGKDWTITLRKGPTRFSLLPSHSLYKRTGYFGVYSWDLRKTTPARTQRRKLRRG